MIRNLRSWFSGQGPNLAKSVGHGEGSAVNQTGVANCDQPHLTMPKHEAETLRAAYEAADVILEYGSGGSTVLAAEMPAKQVYSVESDHIWAKNMQRWFKENPPADKTNVEIVWADIGKTKNWGHPEDQSCWQQFANYPLAVWQRAGLQHPDVVLVDGRFRIGCALATAFSIKRPVKLLFDDYLGRKRLHKVETYLGKPNLSGRMAIFDIEPQIVPPDRLLQIIGFMIHP